MKTRKLFFDFGNGDGKWFNGREYGHFRHALAPLSMNDWQRAVGRGKTPPPGYAMVNGMPFAIGDAARRHIIRQRPLGAARYTETYYGVGLAYAMSEAFKRSEDDVVLYLSHAPQDIDYAPDLMRAASGRWEIICDKGDFIFNVAHVETVDEPMAGLCHYTLTQDGREKQNNATKEKTTLIVDVGAHTTDVGAIDVGGIVDVESFKSTRAGAIELKERFEDNLRSENRRFFQNAHDLDIRRIEDALLTGTYKAGKVKIDCKHIAEGAINELTNDVLAIIEAAGGFFNYDLILMTGGGAVLIHKALTVALPHIDFVMVEKNRELMRYANAFGGWKLFKMLERIGAV